MWTFQSVSTIKAEFAPLLVSWYGDVARDDPWRRDWSRTGDPYFVWLSEVMLQQTTLDVVRPAYERFTRAFPSVLEVARHTEEEVLRHLKGLGYYRRFRFFYRGCQEYSGSWPSSYQEWLKFPGVGPYTAAALASITNGEPVGVLDGNVVRVLMRLFNIDEVPVGRVRTELQLLANALVHHSDPGAYNQAIMELGQRVCTPKNPACSSCPVQGSCDGFKAGTVGFIPRPPPKPEYQAVALDLLILQHSASGEIGLTRRGPKAKFLKNTLGFSSPQIDGAIDAKLILDSKILGAFKHSITRYRLAASVRYLSVSARPSGLEWVGREGMARNLVASLDSKAWAVFNNQPLLPAQ